MLTREEYEKTLVRMFDNIRGEKYRGDKSCEGVNCADCPFNDEDCYMSNAFEAIEIVENGVKNIPLQQWKINLSRCLGVSLLMKKDVIVVLQI